MDFYTGLVATMYRHLRSETFDPQPYARFVRRYGSPALELGCGDGDPMLDLRAEGLDVEGLDASLDMLDRCRGRDVDRGVDVVLHHATFDSKDLGRRYRSIYLAGATFNLLPDDRAAQLALHRIAAHLEPDGAVLIPLEIPRPFLAQWIGSTKQVTQSDGSVMKLTYLAVERDDQQRNQTIRLLYEMTADGVEERVERDWLLHWFDQDRFRHMVEEAGLRVGRVLSPDGSPSGPDDPVFSFLLRAGPAPSG